MRFEGQVWFNFSAPPVWVFYRWVRALAATGVDVTLEWMPLPNDAEQVAMATLLSVEQPQDRGRFLHAMLGLVHLEGRSASDTKTVAEALRAARLDSLIARDEHPLLEDLGARSDGLGVDAVPTLYRHGPPLSIQLSTAVLGGDVRQTARTINEVMESDGIWELRKP